MLASEFFLPLMPFARFCQVRLMSRFVDVSFNVYIVVWMYCIDSMLASLGGNDNSTHTSLLYLRYGGKCFVNWASQHVHFAVGIC